MLPFTEDFATQSGRHDSNSPEGLPFRSIDKHAKASRLRVPTTESNLEDSAHPTEEKY
jgi:hypothetical protein